MTRRSNVLEFPRNQTAPATPSIPIIDPSVNESDIATFSVFAEQPSSYGFQNGDYAVINTAAKPVEGDLVVYGSIEGIVSLGVFREGDDPNITGVIIGRYQILTSRRNIY